MARILIAGSPRWYESLKSVAYCPEGKLEKWILQHAASIFPDHLVFPFKKTITHQAAAISKVPDIALIRRDFCAWTLIEVELEEHPLEHVLEQTRCFVEGDYNSPDLADYARKKLKEHCNRDVPTKRLAKLFSSEPPSVLVISEAPVPDWEPKLKSVGVGLCVFEVYKSPVGRYVYRTSGQYPVVAAREAQCRFHRSISNMLEVTGPFEFKNLRNGDEVEVIFDESLTRWSLLTEGNRRYLKFLGASNPLSPNDTYRLFRNRSHQYFLARS